MEGSESCNARGCGPLLKRVHRWEAMLNLSPVYFHRLHGFSSPWVHLSLREDGVPLGCVPQCDLCLLLLAAVAVVVAAAVV